jgi:uncharacterized protein YbjT (DUF2867 family)
MKTVILLGASGMVGQAILQRALASPEVGSVVAPSRRPLAAHPKLLNPLVDFAQLPLDAAWWQADVLVSALGSTRRQAGSAAAFSRIDHDQVLQAARLACAASTPVMVNISSQGADPAARGLYRRVKGLLEQDLAALGFVSLYHVRPSLLDTPPRPELRIAERCALFLLKRLGLLLPLRYRPVRHSQLADCVLGLALWPVPGIHLIESEGLHS